MSKTPESATAKSKPAAQRAEVGPAMFGRDIFVEALERENVEVIFAYPGGASMEIHQSLTKSKIRTILPRHEQGGSFAAEGYARVTGKAGVCMGTSGPGATNLVTAIADAYMDSCPLIAITGQVTQAMIGRGAFQETDIIGVTLPIVKHSYLLTDINDIPRVVKEAFYIAQSGRPGPVVIDFPKNLQQQKAQPVWPKPLIDSDQASLEVRRSGPLVVLVSGDAIPDESHRLLESVNFEANVMSVPQPMESEVAKTGKLLIGIVTLVIIGASAAVLLGFFLGGFRAAYRIARGKPISSVYDEEFIRIDLRDDRIIWPEAVDKPHLKG